ncbi:hypothetical protein ACE38W_19290 [Chitinophaga sp. Hz27]|uniref:hypothetical protein n=1 Tax=Chitinophaga sp. Hz27 TaxID=3347169 RepID=UPI0035DD09D8
MSTETVKKKSRIKLIVGAVVLIFLIWFFVGGGKEQQQKELEKQAHESLQSIQNQVAVDAEQQYEIAKKQGDKMQTYVQAGLVAAAYLQAKDEENYNKWKAIEKEAGKEAGIFK